MSYEEKIYAILENRLEYNGDNTKAISDVKTWLACEWQCDMIESMDEYVQLRDKVDDIAADIIKTL